MGKLKNNQDKVNLFTLSFRMGKKTTVLLQYPADLWIQEYPALLSVCMHLLKNLGIFLYTPVFLSLATTAVWNQENKNWSIFLWSPKDY